MPSISRTSVGIPKINSLGARDDARAFLRQQIGLREGMDVMRRIERLPMFCLTTAAPQRLRGNGFGTRHFVVLKSNG